MLRQALDDNMLTARLDEFKAMELWKRMMGPGITSLCTSITVNRGIMTIALPSAPLRHEMMMHRTEMARRINERFNRAVISEIRFVN